MISIICVSNKQDILEKELKTSLENQSTTYEFIVIDNSTNQYSCAAEALNIGAQKAKGDFFVFCHQDISWSNPFFIEELELKLKALPQLFVAGAAGKCKQYPKTVIGNITQSNPPHNLMNSAIAPITKPFSCQTLDEVFLCIPRIFFEKMRFDEIVCYGWHLYSVDYCLSAIENNIPIFVIPLQFYHASIGASFNNSYYGILKKVVRKHRKKFKKIYTTMGNWVTNPITIRVFILYKQLRNKVKKLFTKNKLTRAIVQAYQKKKYGQIYS